MKLTRRNFLKSGPITAIALAIGLKPKAPARTHFGHKVVPPGTLLWPANAAYYSYLRNVWVELEQMPLVTMPLTQKQLAYLRNLWLELEFLRGDPRFHCIGVLK